MIYRFSAGLPLSVSISYSGDFFSISVVSVSSQGLESAFIYARCQYEFKNERTRGRESRKGYSRMPVPVWARQFTNSSEFTSLANSSKLKQTKEGSHEGRGRGAGAVHAHIANLLPTKLRPSHADTSIYISGDGERNPTNFYPRGDCQG